MPHRVRVILDEDVPPALAPALRQRGIAAVAVSELKPSLWPGESQISDEQVCEAVATEPTILVTLNLRDYADPAFQAATVAAHRIAVVILRVPKAESRFPKVPPRSSTSCTGMPTVSMACTTDVPSS